MIAILFLYKYRENITTDSGKTLSDEAVQSIASVYNNQNMTVTNLNASNQANLNNAKVTGNLNVSGTTILNNLNVSNTSTLNNLNVSSNIITSESINVSKNIIINNKGMVTWRQAILWGRPQQVQAKDQSGNIYSADDWFVYAGGWGVSGIGACNTFIDSASNTWFLRVWATDNPTNNAVDVFAIPKGYFSNIFRSTYT